MDYDNFYLVLPSNSSMIYFPDNTTSCFNTHLSRGINLNGNWLVGIAEIHIPCTILQIRNAEAMVKFRGKEADAEKQEPFPSGVYENLTDLIYEINKTSIMGDHFSINQSKFEKGYFYLQKNCECKETHFLTLDEKIRCVLGFEERRVRETGHFVADGSLLVSSGNRPASLARAIPDQLFVYTDLCEPYTVGDTQAALLRIVSLDATKYKFGANVVRHFAAIHYIPLLQHSFRSVVIDIRDQHGRSIPFEYGTLTVTLHFKRNH